MREGFHGIWFGHHKVYGDTGRRARGKGWWEGLSEVAFKLATE